MYNTDVRDLIDVRSVKSGLDLSDIIRIGKRVNNSKRDYLFINTLLGKHIPALPSSILSLYSSLYSSICSSLSDCEKILVVSFAETATCLGEYIFLQSIDCSPSKSSKPLDFVYYLQTTRETFESDLQLLHFTEDHSHAVNQCVYCNGSLPEYYNILFIEDEITTGNTILNFISAFDKISPYTNYFVASFLNWQSSSDISRFKEKGIESIYLVKGELVSDVPSLCVKEDKVLDLSLSSSPFSLKTSTFTRDNLRLGLSRYSYLPNCRFSSIEASKLLSDFICQGDIVDVIGTEEFMFVPLLCASHLESMLGPNSVTFHATTRSPICVSSESGYIVSSGIQLSSAYDEDRVTYLYNIPTHSNKIVCITEKGSTSKFKSQLSSYFHDRLILFIEV